MTRFILGTLLAAVAMFLWGMIFFMSPIPYGTLEETNDDRMAGAALVEHFPTSGTYFVPSMKSDDDSLMMEMFTNGPIATVNIQREGMENMWGGMITGFVLMLITAALLMILLRTVSSTLRTYSSRVIFVLLVSLAASLYFNLSDSIWWHAAWSWSLMQCLYSVVSWLVAGLVLAKFSGPDEATA